MGLHARYVILDAEGRLPKRPAKKKAEKKAAKRAAEKQTVQADVATSGDVTAEDSAASGGKDATDADGGEEESDDAESGDKWVAVDPPHGTSQPVLKRVTPGETPSVPSAAQKVVVPGPASSSSGADADDGKLSKADRKALKKKLIEERMKREQRKAANW
jgi:hypothetical protein